MDYLSILNSDLNIATEVKNSKVVSLDWIHREFPAILKKSGVVEQNILLGYLLGSHAKNKATPYSDIDFNFYTKGLTKDVWFKHKGRVISIFVDKLTDVENLIMNSSDVIWYENLLKTAVVFIDKANYLSKLEDLTNRAKLNTYHGLINTQIRKVVEYRRKLYSLTLAEKTASFDELIYLDFAKKYFDNYILCIAYMGKVSVSSESMYIHEILSFLPQTIRSNFENLLNSGSSISVRTTSLEETYHYFVENFSKP